MPDTLLQKPCHVFAVLSKHYVCVPYGSKKCKQKKGRVSRTSLKTVIFSVYNLLLAAQLCDLVLDLQHLEIDRMAAMVGFDLPQVAQLLFQLIYLVLPFLGRHEWHLLFYGSALTLII
jgi:hypothetical protein